MKDVLIPIGVPLFIALFIYAIVKEGKRHQKAPNVFFKKLAEHKGWKYLKEDDGTALHVSNGFEGIGVFSSPSLGKMIPRNVVHGRMKVGNCCLFEHHTRTYEGYAMSKLLIRRYCRWERCKSLSRRWPIFLGASTCRSEKTASQSTHQVGISN